MNRLSTRLSPKQRRALVKEVRDKPEQQSTVEFNVRFGKANKGLALASSDGFGVFVARLSTSGLALAGELSLLYLLN